MNKNFLFSTIAAVTLVLGMPVLAASQTDGEYMDWSYVRDVNADPQKNTSAPVTKKQDSKPLLPLQDENDQVYVTEGIIPVPKTTPIARDLDTGYTATANRSLPLAATTPMKSLAESKWNINQTTPPTYKLNLPTPQPGSVQFQYPVQVKYPVQIKYPVQVEPQVTVQRPIMVTQPIVVQRPVVMTQPVTVQQPPMYYQNQPITMQQSPIYMTNQPMVVQQPAYAPQLPMNPMQSIQPMMPAQQPMAPMMPLSNIAPMQSVPMMQQPVMMSGY